MKYRPLSLRARFKSFGFAFKGIRGFFWQEPNARLHLVATLAVLSAGIFCSITNNEMIALVVVTGFVWAAEIINTAIERIMDFISTDRDPKIELIKDLAAGAVLVSAITAIVVAALVFIPKLF